MKLKIMEAPAVIPAPADAAHKILTIIDNLNLISELPATGSSYIMPNGDFIDLKSHGFRTHAAFDEYIKDFAGILYDKTLLPIKYCNAIRVNDGSNFFGEIIIELPKNPITSAQASSIDTWLDFISDKTDIVTVTITGTNEFVEYNLTEQSTWNIVKKIKGYYTSGILHEGKYIDPEGRYSDYGTGTVTGANIFDDRVHVPFYDRLFTNPKQMADEENLKGHVEMMSPREYYKICADIIFECSIDNLKRSRGLDDQVNEEIKEIITKYKRQVFMPYINYAEKTQEGLHRMLVAAELFGWDQEFPVLIIEWADEERAKRHAKEKHDTEIRRYIKRAVDRALEYNYTDLEDFKDNLKYILDQEFEYVIATIKSWSISHSNGVSSVTVNEVTYDFATNDINIKEVEEDDFDIEDIDYIEFSDEELADIENLSLDDFLKKYG